MGATLKVTSFFVYLEKISITSIIFKYIIKFTVKEIAIFYIYNKKLTWLRMAGHT